MARDDGDGGRELDHVERVGSEFVRAVQVETTVNDAS